MSHPFKISRREFGLLSGAILGASSRTAAASEQSPGRWIPRAWNTVLATGKICWSPQAVRLQTGRLLVSYLWDDPPKTSLIRSSDDGVTWSVPQIIEDRFRYEGGGGHGLTQLRSGRLLMAYLDVSPWPRLPLWPPASEPRMVGRWPDKGLQPWAWDIDKFEGDLRVLASEDDGKNWDLSEPLRCSPWEVAIPHGCGPLFEIENSVYMPVWGWLSNRDNACGFLRSDDQGRTWSAGPIVANGQRRDNLQYRELAVTILANGEWLALCRVNSPNYFGLLDCATYITRSSNGGKTWSEPEPALGPLAWPRLSVLPDKSVLACGACVSGIRGLFSYNGGESWLEESFFRFDYLRGMGMLDFGSASAVSLDDDCVLLIYYAPEEKSKDCERLLNPVNALHSILLNRYSAGSREVLTSPRTGEPA